MTAVIRSGILAPFGADPASHATILSDLSANIFAALLIVLILLLQLKTAADGLLERPVEATRSVSVRAHVGLRPADTVAMLRTRASAAEGAAFDVVEAGIRRADGMIVAGDGAIDEALRVAPGRDPVRLYVFSHLWFAQVTGTLTAVGRSWLDLSVPRALRAPTDRNEWSPEFLHLLSEPGDDTSFRTGLARLLAASVPLVPDGHVAVVRGNASSAKQAGVETLLLLPVLYEALGLSALVGGSLLVFWTERRTLHAICSRTA